MHNPRKREAPSAPDSPPPLKQNKLAQDEKEETKKMLAQVKPMIRGRKAPVFNTDVLYNITDTDKSSTEELATDSDSDEEEIGPTPPSSPRMR